jgi:hypothetical protein
MRDIEKIINIYKAVSINKRRFEKSYQNIAIHCRTDFWCCSFFKNSGECSLFEKRLEYTCDGVPISLEECRINE